MRDSDNRSIINACFDRLLAELGPKKGGRAIRIIVEDLGGLLLHMPSLKTLEIEARDAAIKKAFMKGENYFTIANQWGLKVRHVKRIING